MYLINNTICFQGITRCWTRTGILKSTFVSLLPAGGQESLASKTGYTILDCIFDKKTEDYYILDVIAWNGVSYRYCDVSLHSFSYSAFTSSNLLSISFCISWTRMVISLRTRTMQSLNSLQFLEHSAKSRSVLLYNSNRMFQIRSSFAVYMNVSLVVQLFISIVWGINVKSSNSSMNWLKLFSSSVTLEHENRNDLNVKFRAGLHRKMQKTTAASFALVMVKRHSNKWIWILSILSGTLLI